MRIFDTQWRNDRIAKRRFFPVAVALFLSASTAGCPRPATEQDLYIAQSMIDIQDALTEIRQATWELQERVDSLRVIVAQRDSVVRQLANLAGVVVPP